VAVTLHVNGVATVSVGTGGSGALELLGHSLDGVGLEFQDMREPVYSDAGGGENMLPIDYQEFGEVATIVGDMVIYDEAVLTKIRKRPGATAEGLLSAPGRVMGPNGDFYRLLVTSPTEALPWNFPTSFLMRKPIRLSTKRSIWRLQWFAFAYIGPANSALGAVLYNRATS
jgi:hypothetical protein